LSQCVLYRSVSIPDPIVMQRMRSRSFFLPARSGNLSLSPFQNHSEEGQQLTPFFKAEERVVASVSISGPTIPISPKAVKTLSPVIEYTQRISCVLGYVWPSSSAETNSQDLIAHTLSMSQFNEH
jgi:hypothetical protein